jgi:hypothetical protein
MLAEKLLLGDALKARAYKIYEKKALRTKLFLQEIQGKSKFVRKPFLKSSVIKRIKKEKREKKNMVQNARGTRFYHLNHKQASPIS